MIWWASKQQPTKSLQQRSRVPYLIRERAAYIKLRRVGLSINQISKAFGRSTSQIFKVIKNAEGLQTLRGYDLRKLPSHIRRRSASFRWQTLMKHLSAWEMWIAGCGEKPP